LGQPLWDQAGKKRLVVKMGVLLSEKEDMASEVEVKKQEELMTQKAKETIKNSKELEEARSREETEMLEKIREENERLKWEKEKLEEELKRPPEPAKEPHPEVEKAKSFYLEKNAEIEELIKKVMK